MGGHGGGDWYAKGHLPFGGFQPPKASRAHFWTKIYMTGVWFFIMYRFKQDGPHHFVKGEGGREETLIHTNLYTLTYTL